MARFKDLEGVKTSNLFRVPPHLLIEDPGFNIRVYDDDAETLIEEYTQKFLAGSRCPPLEVWLNGENITIIEGHLRRRAALRAIERGAEIKDVDCIHFTGNDVARVVHMLQSGDGREWRPLERCTGYMRLQAWGWSEAEIAKVFGKTVQHVSNILALANADSAVQAMVKSGDVSATLAVQTIRQEGQKAAETLTAAVETAKAAGKSKATAKDVTKVRGGPSAKEIKAALTALVAETKQQKIELTDPSFDETIFHIPGKLLRPLIPN